MFDRTHSGSAERIFIAAQREAPLKVVVKIDDKLKSGQFKVKVSGSDKNLVSFHRDGNTEVIDYTQPIGNIRVKNTGPATAGPGGNANSGVQIGGAPPRKRQPGSASYTRVTSNTTLRNPGSKRVTVTITVALGQTVGH